RTQASTVRRSARGTEAAAALAEIDITMPLLPPRPLAALELRVVRFPLVAAIGAGVVAQKKLAAEVVRAVGLGAVRHEAAEHRHVPGPEVEIDPAGRRDGLGRQLVVATVRQ